MNACGRRPKIEPGDYSDLYRSLVKLVSTSNNLQVQMHGINAIWCLIEGLRGSMKREVRGLIKWLIPFYKNKKPQLDELLDKLIETTTKYCIPLEDSALIFIDNMSPTQTFPQIRCSIIKYITKQIPNLSDNEIGLLLPGLYSCFSEGNKDIRDEIFSFSTTFVRTLGDTNPISKQILAELQKQNQSLHKRVITDLTSVKKESPKKAAQKSPEKKKKVEKKTETKLSSTTTKKVKEKEKSGNDTPIEPLMSAENAIAILDQGEIVEWNNIKEKVKATVWAEKSEGYTLLKNYVANNDSSELCEAILVYLYSLNNGFKIGMLNLSLSVYEILSIIAQKANKEKKLFHYMIKNTIDKLSEKKLTQYYYEIYNQSCSKISPHWTIEYVLTLIDKSKSAVIHTIILNYFLKAIPLYGVKTIGLKTILDYLCSNTV